MIFVFSPFLLVLLVLVFIPGIARGLVKIALVIGCLACLGAVLKAVGQ